jgi:hypothetical protein
MRIQALGLALHELPNKACTGRLGVCAFFGFFLNDGISPFPVLFLPSRR